MSSKWACLLRGRDLAGGALALSAGGVPYFITQALCKKASSRCYLWRKPNCLFVSWSSEAEVFCFYLGCVSKLRICLWAGALPPWRVFKSTLDFKVVGFCCFGTGSVLVAISKRVSHPPGRWEPDSALSCPSIVLACGRERSHEGYLLNERERWAGREEEGTAKINIESTNVSLHEVIWFHAVAFYRQAGKLHSVQRDGKISFGFAGPC